MASPAHYDWNDLYFFLAVARAGRLTVAARRLGVEHSTVSRRIAALEGALNTRLFERRPTGLFLTPSGERLLPMAEAMETSASAILSTIGDADLAVSGTVRIGAPDGVGSYFLAPRLGLLTRDHPGLEIELIAMPRLFNLSKREADIAIGLSEPKNSRLHAQPLSDYELGLYATESYLANAPPLHQRSDLAAHRFIAYADDFIFAPELDYVPLVQRDLRPTLKSSNIIAQMNATVAGAGLCLLPCFMAESQPTLRRLLPRELRLFRSFWLITHADVRGLARVWTTLNFILREAEAARWMFLPNGMPTDFRE